MENFEHYIPTKVYFGKDQIKNLASAIKERIAKLDTKQSCFFSHRDPKMVKMLSMVKLDI